MASPSTPQHLDILAEHLHIRRMRPQDAPEVMVIESVSYGRHHWSEDAFHNEMGNPSGRYYTLLDTFRNALIGYCGFWVVLDEAHITTVAIDPAYRGNALGELLVAHILERAMSHSAHWATLEVRVSNHGAQNLYYKYGFSSVGTRPAYYQDNQEDALIMTTGDILSQDYRQAFRQRKDLLKARLHGLPTGFGDS